MHWTLVYVLDWIQVWYDYLSGINRFEQYSDLVETK